MTKWYAADVDGLKAPAVFERLYRTLPLHRKDKIEKLRFEKDKRRCMGAWLLLMHALQAEGIAEREICLSYGEHGKPYLADHPELFFNLSHSGNRVLCAVSDGEVGCDVQKIKRYDGQLAERFFSPEEYGYLSKVSKEERDTLFFRYWTLKESFIKNIGTGLALPLNQFSIQLSGDGVGVKQQVLPEETFFFRDVDSGDGYRYACCARRQEIGEIEVVRLV